MGTWGNIKESLSDFASDAYDVVSDICEQLKEWGKKVWDWTKHLFINIYDKISSWIDVLSDTIQDFFNEVEDWVKAKFVLAKPEMGPQPKELTDLLTNIFEEHKPMSLQDFKSGKSKISSVALKDDKIEKASFFQAGKISNPEQFDKMMQENDGILVVANN